MCIWQSANEIPQPWPGCVVVIGVFDGLHKGHAQVIAHAQQQAQQLQLPLVMMTFDPHPRTVVSHKNPPELLTDVVTRCDIARSMGVDYCYAVKFTPELARLEPEEFVRTILVSQLHAKYVIVGKNFRFGAQASGNYELLQSIGQQYGFGVEAHNLVEIGDRTVSASAVRVLLKEGKIPQANHILGRNYRLEGIVERGQARGRELGYPTANLHVDRARLIPDDGVYAGWFYLLSEERHSETEEHPPAPKISENPIELHQKYPCAISVGTNPTFASDDPVRTVEAYIIGASRDLYTMRVAVEFVNKVRGQCKFNDIEELVTTIGDDVDKSLRILQAEQ